MHRFFTESDLNPAVITILEKEEIHHIRTVLRLKPGNEIVLFDGGGEEVLVGITAVTGRKVTAEKRGPLRRPALESDPVVLACAIPKKAKFESIIEKCTELGVAEIIPLLTARTEIRLADDRAGKKWARYQAVARNAAKQSQRATVPVVHAPASWTSTLARIPPGTQALLPCLQGEREPILTVLKRMTPGQCVMVCIGPEGDFTPREIEQGLGAGLIPVTLGPTVLKVDTAAIAAVAAVQLFREA